MHFLRETLLGKQLALNPISRSHGEHGEIFELVNDDGYHQL